MKFRGKLIDGNCIKQFMSTKCVLILTQRSFLFDFTYFSGILGCMTKLGKSCVIRITPTHMYFIVRESQTISSSPLIWCTLDQAHFFFEYGMEGLSTDDNEIYMEFMAGNINYYGYHFLVLVFQLIIF